MANSNRFNDPIEILCFREYGMDSFSLRQSFIRDGLHPLAVHHLMKNTMSELYKQFLEIKKLNKGASCFTPG